MREHRLRVEEHRVSTDGTNDRHVRREQLVAEVVHLADARADMILLHRFLDADRHRFHVAARAASCGSRSPNQPPMFTRLSFLPDIVAPSAHAHISSRICAIVLSRWPGSRCWMNHAFSTARVASKMTLIPRASVYARTARR